MTIKVSVVVAVYNPGEHLQGLVDSLVAQSLPAEDFEVIFVDDGSTDGSRERLQQICSEQPNMRTVTIPASGWPGRPRNIGTDLAEGEYVFYSDNDDYLFPEALERVYALAARTGADIVFPKVVRTGRPGDPPRHRDIDVADPIKDDLVSSRTVHKLFRRAFLVEHGIRFLEGRVRLEDHQFMAQALPRAQVVSVLADYPVYKWIHRSDGTNASSDAGGSMPPHRYWEFYGGAVRTFAETAGEGELLDAARVVAAHQSFSRLSLTKWRDMDDEHRVAVMQGAGHFLEVEIPPNLDDRLPAYRRMRVKALREQDHERFAALTELRAAYVMKARVERVAWVGTELDLAVRATLTGDPGLTLMRPRADDSTLVLPLPSGVRGKEAGRVLRSAELGAVQLTVRHRTSGVEWPIPGASRSEPVSMPDGVRLTVWARGRIDAATCALGEPLDEGAWELVARVQFLGETEALRPEGDSLPRMRTVRAGERTSRPGFTSKGRLELKVRSVPGGPAGERTLAGLTWRGIEITLRLERDPGPGSSVVLRGSSLDAMVSAPIIARRARLAVDGLRPGQSGDLYVRLAGPAGILDERLLVGAATLRHEHPYVASADAEGGLRLGHLMAREESPDDPADTDGGWRGRARLALRDLRADARSGDLRADARSAAQETRRRLGRSRLARLRRTVRQAVRSRVERTR